MEKGNKKKTSATGGQVVNADKKSAKEPTIHIDMGKGETSRTCVKTPSLDNLEFVVRKRDGEVERFSMQKISQAIAMALGKLDGLDPDTAFSPENVDEINEMFAKDGFELTLADLETVFQKQFIHEHLLSADSHRDEEQEETTKKKRGRPKLTRLFEKIRDSRVCQLFSKVMNKMKSKLEATIEWLNQFIVCFLTSIGDIVKEDAYGRITHYREMLEAHLNGWKLPTARTIQYGYDWLRNKNKEKEDTAKTRQKRWKWRKMCDRITALLRLEPDLQPAIA